MPTELQNDNSGAVLSVSEWCRLARISESLFFKKCREGQGPHIARLGRRTLVIEAPADYLRRIAVSA